jgi:hypothetical protein
MHSGILTNMEYWEILLSEWRKSTPIQQNNKLWTLNNFQLTGKKH